jgi:hypothetical protein
MTQINSGLIPTLKKSIDIELPDNISLEQVKEILSNHINHLIQNNFQKLVSVLYRIDVSEEKLKYLLKENADKDTSQIITDLIIERQLQKIKSREEFKNMNRETGEDSW